MSSCWARLNTPIAAPLWVKSVRIPLRLLLLLLSEVMLKEAGTDRLIDVKNRMDVRVWTSQRGLRGQRARGGKQITPTELLLDTRTTPTTGPTNPALEPVGAINRPAL